MITVKKPFYVKKYLSEEGQEIIKEIANNRTVGILAPMNVGKTYFMLTDLKDYCLNENYKLIIVIPTKAQLDQLLKRDKEKILEAQYGIYKAKEKARVVLTTPDSLLKIIKNCEKLSQKFILAIDEAHEIELSYMYRKSFKNILIASNNLLCKCTLYFSSTLDNLILSNTVEFDKFLDVQVENKFFNAINFNIITIPKLNTSKIATFIKEKGKKFDKVFYKVDSVSKLNNLNEILNKEDTLTAIIEEKEKNIYLCSKNRDNNEINKQIIADEEISNEYKYIGFTSLVNSGIEIKTSKTEKIAVINFTNETFNFLNEIQFIGRFRSGVDSYFLIIKKSTKEKAELLNYETITNNIKQYAKETIEHENKMYNKFKNIFYNVEYARLKVKDVNYISFNEEENKFEIDEIALNSHCFNLYIKQYLNYPKALLTKFKNHQSLNVKEYAIMDFDEEDLNTKELVKQVKEDIDKQKKERKQKIKKSMLYIANNCTNKTIKLLLDKQLAIQYEDNTELKQHLKNWQELKQNEEDKIYTLTNCIKNISNVKAFKIIANLEKEKDFKDLLENVEIIFLNNIYDSDSSYLDITKNKKYYKLKITRDYVKTKKGESNGKVITKEMQKELFNIYLDKDLIKNKKFTKAQQKALINYLKKIYVFKKCYEEKQQLVISSVLKNVKDLESISSTI